jgi:hypothetical protein
MNERTTTKTTTRAPKATTPRRRGRASHPAPAETAQAERVKTAPVSGGPSLPVLVPAVHVRHVPLPKVGLGHVPVPRVYVPVSETVRRQLPDRATNRVLWFGGLVGLAALGVIDWPVAGVVAAATYIAERRAEAAVAHELREEGHAEPKT